MQGAPYPRNRYKSSTTREIRKEIDQLAGEGGKEEERCKREEGARTEKGGGAGAREWRPKHIATLGEQKYASCAIESTVFVLISNS